MTKGHQITFEGMAMSKDTLLANWHERRRQYFDLLEQSAAMREEVKAAKVRLEDVEAVMAGAADPAREEP